ncbi:HET-domain-containing protein [Cubamyces sp. BRFM 1775]|nr:HET-domain-containing protein [Cubamyces sp. BRFM 1775]
MYTTADDPAAPYIAGRLRIPHVGAPEVLALARTCVEECTHDHEACKAIAFDAAPLPRRLVDCSHPHRVRIIETDGSTQGRRYVALSYVWGGAQPQRTTTANLASHMHDGMDPAILPQTIQDAIRVAQALGIPFLWIDSLCIVQDSAEDKHRELASMCDVYRHAYITIDVARATTVTEGFLQDCLPLYPHVVPLTLPPNHEGLPAKLSDPEARTAKVYLDPAHEDKVTRAEWLWGASETARRGWCLQETLLSRRSLVFTWLTVQLRCRAATQNVGGAAHDGRHDFPRLPDDILLPDRRLERGSVEWEQIHQMWHQIVEDYSGRLHSYAEDKLVACAAIAKMFAPVLGPGYVAGLWRGTLPYDLLWRGTLPYDLLWRGPQRGDEPRPRIHKDDCAPSWSWASYDDRVQYVTYADEESSMTVAEVIECSVTPQDEALRYGPTRPGGALVLRAQLCPCRCYQRQPGQAGTLDLEVVSLAPLQVLDRLRLEASLDSEAGLCYTEGSDERNYLEVWAIPLVGNASGARKGERVVDGLIVARAEQSTPLSAPEGGQGVALYRRVGVFTGFWDIFYPGYFTQTPRVEITLV